MRVDKKEELLGSMRLSSYNVHSLLSRSALSLSQREQRLVHPVERFGGHRGRTAKVQPNEPLSTPDEDRTIR
jgi:hypothetical protein